MPLRGCPQCGQGVSMELSKKRVFSILFISIVFFLVGSIAPLSAKTGAASGDTTIELNSYNNIFLGWVDLNKEHWSLHGYKSIEDWSDAIDRLNNIFQASCKTRHLSKKTITGALQKDDKRYEGADLYLEFSNIQIDYDHYDLYLVIDFIDVKTQKIVYSIPRTKYYGSAWGFEDFLKAALEKVNEKIAKTIIAQTVDLAQARERGQSLEGKSGSKDSVFLGWIDLHPENWALHSFSSQEDWEVMINRVNNYFQVECGISYLKDKEIKGAASVKDTDFAGNNLYIKFSEVRLEDKKSRLFLAIEFIDVKTGKSLFKVPVTGYKGKTIKTWGFENILKKSLQRINIKISEVVKTLNYKN